MRLDPGAAGSGCRVVLAPAPRTWTPGTTGSSRRACAPMPQLASVDIRQLALSPALDLAMFGAGGLMGIRAAGSLLLGHVLNFVVIVPGMISDRRDPAARRLDRRRHRASSAGRTSSTTGRCGGASRSWWWRRSVALFAQAEGLHRGVPEPAPAWPQMPTAAPTCWPRHRAAAVGLVGRRSRSSARSASGWSRVVRRRTGIFGALAIPLIIVLTLIAASSTALTGITPTGSLSKIPQFTVRRARPDAPAAPTS